MKYKNKEFDIRIQSRGGSIIFKSCKKLHSVDSSEVLQVVSVTFLIKIDSHIRFLHEGQLKLSTIKKTMCLFVPRKHSIVLLSFFDDFDRHMQLVCLI